ncbi:hypothetical protein KM043_006588 [Ampulex compressa]|nr:hypothetical protein KM043_006588 [Ampulex compressa]
MVANVARGHGTRGDSRAVREEEEEEEEERTRRTEKEEEEDGGSGGTRRRRRTRRRAWYVARRGREGEGHATHGPSVISQHLHPRLLTDVGVDVCKCRVHRELGVEEFDLSKTVAPALRNLRAYEALHQPPKEIPHSALNANTLEALRPENRSAEFPSAGSWAIIEFPVPPGTLLPTERIVSSISREALSVKILPIVMRVVGTKGGP